jgi:hypothetical protein
MKNLLVANAQDKGRYDLKHITTLCQAQVENSIECGWEPEDIILLTNFEFDFMGVDSHVIELNENCLRGSKLYGMKHLFDTGQVNGEAIWAHDLDAWQNCWFDEPEFKDIGTCYYSQPKINGGSIFWKHQAKYILEAVLKEVDKGAEREEPVLQRMLTDEKFRDRVTVLDHTYNVGCSGFVPRASRAMKPIRVAHMNPTNRIAWETHALDRNQVGIRGIGYRLEKLLRRYYPSLATEVVWAGVKKRKER